MDYQEVCEFLKQGNVLLHGPGGTGKSYTIGKIMKEMKHEKIFCTASTGIAAVNLSTNHTEQFKTSTLHSWSGLKLAQGSVKDCVDIILSNNFLRKKWITTKYLIIDEISMIGADFFDKLEEIARNVRGRVSPFGGIHLLLCGDFLQLPPVSGGWVFKSKCWAKLNIKLIKFETPKRYPDENWFNLLLRARMGMLDEEDVKLLLSRVNAYKQYLLEQNTKFVPQEDVEKYNYSCYMCLNSNNSEDYAKTECECYHKNVILEHGSLVHMQCIMHWMSSSKSIKCPSCQTLFSKDFLEEDYLKVKPTLLYSTRFDVDGLNSFELEKLPSDVKCFTAKDSMKELKTLAVSYETQPIFEGTIPQHIFLKVGAQVMLRRNLDVDSGLANGSRGVVTFISDTGDFVKVRWYNDLETTVSRISWDIEDEKYIRSRSQIPLILAWAMTIHKCQGSTLDYVVCDLGKSVFAPGQAYVALSRVKTLEGLLISKLELSSLYKYDNDAIEFVESN